MSMITIDYGRMWVAEAWTDWTHGGVRYRRRVGNVYAVGSDGTRWKLCVKDTGWPEWRRRTGVAA